MGNEHRISTPDSTPKAHTSSLERVAAAAADHGLTIDITEFPDGVKTANAAADAVGCQVDQIVKSMIFDADGEIILALTSGSNQVDVKALAEAAKASSCNRADPNDVRAQTGFAIGGVAPIGHQTDIRTWIDPHLLDFDVVWAAAGTPRHVFAIDPATLARITKAESAFFTS